MRGAFAPPVILPSRIKPLITQPAPEPAISKRKQFMAVNYVPSTLAMIKDSGLGENRWPRQKPETHKYLYPRPGNQPIEFIAAAKAETSFWPNKERLPEIAIIGRSNVGKSRLLNTLFGTTIVRVKAKPGLTQSINWFKTAAPMHALVVDMPGYGFAYAKPQAIEAWHLLIDRYFQRPLVARAILLIDARHGMKINDTEFLTKLVENRAEQNGVQQWIQIIMTKCDLVPMEILARRHRLVCEEVSKYGLSSHDVTMVSSRTGAGIIELRKSLMAFVKSLHRSPDHI